MLSVLGACLILQTFPKNGIVILVVDAFATPASQKLPAATHPSTMPRSRFTSSLAMGSSNRISIPSQAECEELGVREWPQQSKKGSWNERVDPGNSLVRYVLEGTGSLVIVEDANAITTQEEVRPGFLIDINAGDDPLRLEWECDADCPEVILLTPGFEEANVFLGVIAGIVVLFGALLSGVFG
jgi:hypothetical protein